MKEDRSRWRIGMSRGGDVSGLWMNTEQAGGLDSKIWEGLELLVDSQCEED